MRSRATWVVLAVLAAGVAPARAGLPGDRVNQWLQGVRAAAPAARATPVKQVLFPIPADALAGVMQPPHGRQVRIGRHHLLLAPGAQIRDASNRLVLPGRVRNPIRVRYLLDGRGQVRRVWLLAAP